MPFRLISSSLTPEFAEDLCSLILKLDNRVHIY